MELSHVVEILGGDRETLSLLRSISFRTSPHLTLSRSQVIIPYPYSSRKTPAPTTSKPSVSVQHWFLIPAATMLLKLHSSSSFLPGSLPSPHWWLWFFRKANHLDCHGSWVSLYSPVHTFDTGLSFAMHSFLLTGWYRLRGSASTSQPKTNSGSLLPTSSFETPSHFLFYYSSLNTFTWVCPCSQDLKFNFINLGKNKSRQVKTVYVLSGILSTKCIMYFFHASKLVY